ncbi:T9SS type A sorting domain-containing protein, partial [candidate division KSB1 bacterium]|nr:T9SS type A sorting domain-containing protein [candidate division KSB1 bacterium]
YEDGVWYRRSFVVPDSLQNKYVKLVFYAVNYVADVWLNDQYLGYHEGGYTPFFFDVSSQLQYGESNVLVVRVDNPPWGSRNDIIPFTKADWFNYTGVIHDVYLEASEPLHVVRADVVPVDTQGAVQVTGEFWNRGTEGVDCRVKIEMFEANVTAGNLLTQTAAELVGEEVSLTGETEEQLTIVAGGQRAWRTTLQVHPVRLWWPKSPHLYILKVSLYQQDREIDAYYSQIGIRTIRTDGNRVLLNNKPLFLVGAARHEDHPFYGRSIPAEEILADLQKMVAMNVNFLRTGHYPNHPTTYLYADRLGLCVMEEIPLWWFDNQQVWDIQNNQRHIHEQMWREMVFRDYNRPSIILWGTCNECLDVPNRQIFIQRVHDELDSRYPDGRLVTQSAAANRPGAHDASQASCDVAGWTSYFGVFYGSDYYTNTKGFLNQVQQQYPDKPILITEFGYWSGENGSSATRQRDVFTNTFFALQERAFLTQDAQLNPDGFLMAVTWWCAFDWYTHTLPNGFQSMGIYRMDRNNKKTVTQRFIDTYAPFYANGGTTLVASESSAEYPFEFNLRQNYPNPFNATCGIDFQLCATGHTRLHVYTIHGRLVATLLNETLTAGSHKITFDAGHLPSGLYLAVLSAGGRKEMIKMMLMR